MKPGILFAFCGSVGAGAARSAARRGTWAAAVFAAAFAAAGASWGGLAEELAAEGDWEGARTEIRREALGSGGKAQDGVSEGRILWGAGERERAVARWEEVARDEGAGAAERCAASLELGYAKRLEGDAAGSWEAFRFAFLHATSADAFWEAGVALRATAGEAGGAADAATLDLVRLCRDAWPVGVRRRVRERLGAGGTPWLKRAGQWPGRAVAGFYRSQISPAIGARCALYPSCSAYFLRATAKHGLLGIPMGADRLVREPDVTKAAERWVELRDGRWRIADPVEDHDGWWRDE